MTTSSVMHSSAVDLQQIPHVPHIHKLPAVAISAQMQDVCRHQLYC